MRSWDPNLVTWGLALGMVISFAGGFFLGKSEAFLKRLLSAFLLILACASGIGMLFSTGVVGGCRSNAPDLRIAEYEDARAFVLGAYLSELRPGGKILVITGHLPENKDFKESQLNSFKKGLSAETAVAAVELLEMKKHKKGWIVLADSSNAKRFDELIGMHPECEIIVSFVGLPYKPRNMDYWNSGSSSDRIFAVLDGYIRPLGGLIKEGKISAAVSPMPYWTYDPLLPDDPVERFKQRYILITPDDAEEAASRFHGLLSFD